MLVAVVREPVRHLSSVGAIFNTVIRFLALHAVPYLCVDSLERDCNRALINLETRRFNSNFKKDFHCHSHDAKGQERHV